MFLNHFRWPIIYAEDANNIKVFFMHEVDPKPGIEVLGSDIREMLFLGG
jgi:hypothetical protein